MVPELLEDLSRRGIRLWVHGDGLRYQAPEKALDPGLRAAIAGRKAEIVAFLRERELARHLMGLPGTELRVSADPAHRHDPFPLTDIQEAYWIGASGLLELGNVSAHTYHELEFPSLDLGRFERAWRRLIDRHEMLRAVLLPEGLQRILEETPRFEIPVEDLRGLSPADAERRLEEIRRSLSSTGPDVLRWPLFEVRALRLEGSRVRLALSVSLFLCDALSFRVLLAELDRLYQRDDAPLEDLALSFRDYTLALEAARDGAAHRRALDYWTSRLASLPPAPDLPLARDPGSLARVGFRRCRARLAPVAWDRIKARARAAGVTPTVALAAAYAEVLAAWSGSRRFTLNLLFFNRLPVHPQVEAVVGNFSSTILLEVDATAVESFAERARRLQLQLWNDLEHSQVSGVRVLREWNRSRPPGARSVLPIVLASTLNLAPAAAGGEAAASLSAEVVYGCLQTPQVWLDHQVSEPADGALAFNWDVVEDLFPPGMIDDMAGAYRGLLERLAGSAESWDVPVPPLVPAATLARQAAINATGAPIPEALLHTLFTRQAARRPGDLAVTGDARLTYRELDLLSSAWARRLRAAGARPNALVAVAMERGWEQAVAVLAVLRAGAAYLPADPSLPRERLAYVLEHSGVIGALTQPHLERGLEWPPGIEVWSVRREDEGEAAATEPAEAPEPEPEPAATDLAYVVYTSGSTGFPKGVALDHRGPVNTVVDLVERFHIGPEDRVLALSSLSFDLSVFDLFGPWASGGSSVVPTPAEVREPASWTELVRRERVTIWNSVPALLGMWLDFLAAQPAGTAPASLRLILLSGDWIPVQLPDRARALLPGVEVISMGGATEASIWSILYPIGEVEPGWQSIPYGRPMVNQTFRVLDDRLDERPTWVPGDLYIGGIGLATCYWRDEERTSRSFLRHPRSGERLYRTGDLGRYLPSGDIEFLGRRDLQVKVQGYRIELGEIEAALGRHPAVRSAVAAALGERQGDKRLVAYVVAAPPASGAAPSAAELKDHLRAKLPDYMVPSAVIFLDALPLTANGKVDRAALPAPEAVRAPGEAAAFVAPRNPTEAILAEIWQELLGRAAVGVTDDFFDLGGYSLLAVRLMARIRGRLGRNLPLATLFSASTIARLAELLAGDEVAAASTLVPIRATGEGAPLFFVHPVGGSVLCYAELARRLGPERPFFGLQLTDPNAAAAGIPGLAEAYLREIAAVAPHGPFLLGGWSMGGVIAFEIACRLSERGEEVASLALVDAAVPAGSSEPGEAELLALWSTDLWGLVGAPPPFDAAALAALPAGRRLAAVLARAEAEDVLPAEVDLAAAGRLFDLFRANTLALARFVPRPYPGRALLVRAESGAVPGDDPTWGWGRLAAEVELRWLEGDHFTLVQEPRVEALARLLAADLASPDRTTDGLVASSDTRRTS
jgi:pyochelin synthetase